MSPRIWKRPTIFPPDGRRSKRTVVVNFDLTAEEHQLWVALSIHWQLPLNALAAWAINELARHGVKAEKRELKMGIGLKYPKQKFQSGNRYSKEEQTLWKELIQRKYGRGYAEVLTVALIELYWRKPVDLSIANVSSVKSRQTPEDGEGGERAA